MFFAPAIRNSVPTPALGTLDLGFERFMNDAFKGLGSSLYDLQEDDKHWTLSVDVPGVSKEQLSVQVEGRRVRIATAADASRQFEGSYELSQEVNVEGSEAKLENGVLTVKLAKLEPAPTGRQIAIS